MPLRNAVQLICYPDRIGNGLSELHAALRNNCAGAIGGIQFFTPGIPQVYSVGLLAGCNDKGLMNETGELRDINRHRYSLEEFRDAIAQPVVQRLLALMPFRSSFAAFHGTLELHYSNDRSIAMAWENGASFCELFVDLRFNGTTVRHRNSEDEPLHEFRA